MTQIDLYRLVSALYCSVWPCVCRCPNTSVRSSRSWLPRVMLCWWWRKGRWTSRWVHSVSHSLVLVQMFQVPYQFRHVYIGRLENIMYIWRLESIMYIGRQENILYIGRLENIMYIGRLENILYIWRLENILCIWRLENIMYIDCLLLHTHLKITSPSLGSMSVLLTYLYLVITFLNYIDELN